MKFPKKISFFSILIYKELKRIVQLFLHKAAIFNHRPCLEEKNSANADTNDGVQRPPFPSFFDKEKKQNAWKVCSDATALH